eukprot:355073-Chlamydomonas_euryale.AAC.1
MREKGERWEKPPEEDCCTQALWFLAHPMETKLVRCDGRPYSEPAKPTRQDTLFRRLATDKAPSGRNGNKNDG